MPAGLIGLLALVFFNVRIEVVVLVALMIVGGVQFWRLGFFIRRHRNRVARFSREARLIQLPPPPEGGYGPVLVTREAGVAPTMSEPVFQSWVGAAAALVAEAAMIAPQVVRARAVIVGAGLTVYVLGGREHFAIRLALDEVLAVQGEWDGPSSFIARQVEFGPMA
jgi:hypothetical protein